MASERDSDLFPDKTEGFKVGEKKTVDEYKNMDAGDESLQRYKERLGLGSGTPIADPKDPRTCVILSLTMKSEGRPDVTIDLSTPGAERNLKKQPFRIKEGSKFQMSATFRVQHEVLSGLKYVQGIKRKGIPLNKDEEMIGSYAPSTTDKPHYTKTFPEEHAPSGILARGRYEAKSVFIDDDNKRHLEFEWSFEITKDW